MNIWNAFPFVRYSIALIIGILVYSRVPQLWASYQITLLVFAVPVLLTAFYFRIQNLELFRVLSGFFTLIMLVFLGGILVELNDESKVSKHYLNNHDRIVAFSGTIISDHYEREDYFRYEFLVDQVLVDSANRNVTGRIYLYQRKDSLKSIQSYGTQLFIRGNFIEMEGPKNPDEFNYKQYLARKNIFAQAFVSPENIHVVGEKPRNSLLNFAYKVRVSSSTMISDFIPGYQEAAVLNALVIGVKDYLDTEIKEAYSAAGAMHVLAVSGLHVGIVYLLISLLFGQLKKTALGKVLFVVISLSIVWWYALITGFSPSVMRASTMFSVIILAESSNRKNNIYNSLGLAAFILLLYNPYFVFEVGFQLSFIAVLGIVMLQPPIYRLWNPPNKLFDYLWAIISVSIAAQIVTFPLSILYFHQFPTYFLLSNIIVIPASMVMLSTGLFMLAIGSFSTIAGETIGFLLGGFVEWINWLILWIRNFPFPTVDWLYLSDLSALLLYLFMIYLFQGLMNYHFRALVFAFLCLILLIGNFHLEDYQASQQERIVVYHVRDGVAIDLINGRESQLMTFGGLESQVDFASFASFSINPHRLVSGLQKLNAHDMTVDVLSQDGIHFFIWRGLKVLVIEQGFEKIVHNQITADLIIIRHFREEIMELIQSKNIVIGSMKSYREKVDLINYLKERNIDYFDTNKQGAFILNLRNYAISD